MEHLLFREVASAVMLLVLAAARYHYSLSARAQPVDQSLPSGRRARQIPAYLASTLWAVYVAWLVLAPHKFVQWDRWSPDRVVSDLLGWIAIPILGAGLWLFWYSHSTIGHYWSLHVQLKATHRLVTDGPYAYVRHPLYTALFLGYLGTLLALQSRTLAACFPVFIASYALFAREEENVMEHGFGDTYRAYLRQTGMFLPKLQKIRADVLHKMKRRRASSLAPQRAHDDD